MGNKNIKEIIKKINDRTLSVRELKVILNKYKDYQLRFLHGKTYHYFHFIDVSIDFVDMLICLYEKGDYKDFFTCNDLKKKIEEKKNFDCYTGNIILVNYFTEHNPNCIYNGYEETILNEIIIDNKEKVIKLNIDILLHKIKEDEYDLYYDLENRGINSNKLKYY